MGQTIVEKIAQAHSAEAPKRPLRAGDFVSIRPRHVMTHDNTPGLGLFQPRGRGLMPLAASAVTASL